MHYIYKITNKKTGKYYIGKTKDFKKRKKQHFDNLKKNKHICRHLQYSWNVYEEQNFIFEVIYSNLTEEQATEKEQYYLDHFFEEMYNMSKFSGGGDNISYHPNRDEITKKIAESTKRWMETLTPEQRKEKFGRNGSKNGMYGKIHSSKTRENIKLKLRNYYKENDNYNKGKKAEEYLGEEKAKQFKKKLSKIASERVGEKNPFFGKHHKKETKEKLRKKKTGQKPSNSRPVIIDGVEYLSVTEAGKMLGDVTATILNRIKTKNKKYENYFYKEESKYIQPTPQNKRVMINDVIYPSIAMASEELGIHHSTLSKRLREGAKGYSYAKDELA